MEIKITYNFPLHVEKWNELCYQQSNLIQSSIFDPVQSFYRQKPVYFQCYLKDVLLGGVKLYEWEVTRLRAILGSLSRTLNQFGELIYNSDLIDLDTIKQTLQEAFKAYCNSKKIVSMKLAGYYGNSDLILEASNLVQATDFAVAYIDIAKDKDALLVQMHPKHRNVYKKAVKENLIFVENIKLEVFLELLQRTYSDQGLEGPNLDYVRKVYAILAPQNFVRLYGVKHGDDFLSAAMVQTYGRAADYAFGGNVKNSLGAGQFLQFNICLHLQEIGIQKYSLGQVAIEQDENNLKFSKGISDFKTRFGTTQLLSRNSFYVENPFKYKVFNNIKRLFLHDH